RLLTAVARRPFDLAAGPLIRAVLLTGPGAAPVLALCLHHAICDGWSAALLLRELAELYGAAAARRAPFLPAAAVEYADFASWQRGWLAGATAAGDLAWWRERLAGAPERLALPVDRERQGAPSFRGRLRRLGVAAADAAALRALARRQGATLFMGA